MEHLINKSRAFFFFLELGKVLLLLIKVRDKD